LTGTTTHQKIVDDELIYCDQSNSHYMAIQA